MSSRQEEKEQRRLEREAAEAAAARKASNKGRLQLALGGLAALAAIALAVLLFSGGKDDGRGTDPMVGDAKLPAQKITNLEDAAATAGCKLATTPSEGRTHSTDPKQWIYKTNPPTSGTHNPEWSEDGLYEPGNTPKVGFHVHTLEHGRVDIQYKTGTPKATIDKLETLGSEPLNFGKEGYHVLVFENNTKMKAAVAATAWTHSLTCAKMSDGFYDAVRAFRTQYTDKGPELIP